MGLTGWPAHCVIAVDLIVVINWRAVAFRVVFDVVMEFAFAQRRVVVMPLHRRCAVGISVIARIANGRVAIEIFVDVRRGRGGCWLSGFSNK